MTTIHLRLARQIGTKKGDYTMNSLKKFATLFLAFVLLTVACRFASPLPPEQKQPSEPTPTASEATSPEPTEVPTASPPKEESTIAECRQWLASSQDLNTPIACADWDFFCEKFFEFDGGAFPIGDGRYYLAWFPKNWDNITNRKVFP